MQSQLVFQEKNEIKRLRVQNELLACYEAPVFAQIFSEGQNLAVLDIGCNDGTKTIERFTSDQVSCVIGLEYNEVLAAKAQKVYGNERFSFYPLDVEAEDFAERLRIIMNDKKIDGFDVIYLSFVLMHLFDVKGLLIALRPFLKTDGKLFVIEANDVASTLTGDKNGLLGEFLEMLKKDRYSGNREVGATVCETLSACGYESINVWHGACAEVEVTYLRVTHLTVRKTYGLAACLESGHRVVLAEALDVGSSLSVDDIRLILSSLAPSVEDHK